MFIWECDNFIENKLKQIINQFKINQMLKLKEKKSIQTQY